MIEICQIKYLNNIIEQDHRFIKKITKPMMGFKAFHSAQATIAGIETAHMIRKGQLSEDNIWNKLRGFKLLADVIEGVKFVDGEKQEVENLDSEDRISA
jgi:2-methylcitrate dehydratase PrpD